MDDELLSQRLDRLEREIIALRQHLTDIKGMIAGLSGSIDARSVTNYRGLGGGLKTISDFGGTIMPD
jgi:hypothetical protein